MHVWTNNPECPYLSRVGRSEGTTLECRRHQVQSARLEKDFQCKLTIGRSELLFSLFPSLAIRAIPVHAYVLAYGITSRFSNLILVAQGLLLFDLHLLPLGILKAIVCDIRVQPIPELETQNQGHTKTSTCWWELDAGLAVYTDVFAFVQVHENPFSGLKSVRAMKTAVCSF